MLGAVEHGCESKELALRRLIDDDFLIVLVDGCDAHFAGNKDVTATAFISDFVNSLTRGKLFHLHLAGQHRGFIIVQQGKKGNIP